MAKKKKNTRKRDAWFTRPAIAHSFVKWALDGQDHVKTILEPSAGAGALIIAAKMIRPELQIDSCDIKYPPEFAKRLTRQMYFGDFLRFVPENSYDMSLTNPPYSGDQDTDHLLWAAHCADSVCALVRSNFLGGLKRYERFWSQVYLARLAVFSRRPDFINAGKVKRVAKNPESNYIGICVRRCDEERSGFHSCTQVSWL